MTFYPKYRQWLKTSNCPSGEFMYWGYGVMPGDVMSTFVDPLEPKLPSEQWSGVTDGNGIKVYAGDIFRCIYHSDGHTDHHYEVVYSPENGRYLLQRHGNPCPQTGVAQSIRDVARYPMAGNVHENPELL